MYSLKKVSPPLFRIKNENYDKSKESGKRSLVMNMNVTSLRQCQSDTKVAKIFHVLKQNSSICIIKKNSYGKTPCVFQYLFIHGL